MQETYWALKTGDELATEVKRRMDDYDDFLLKIGRYNRLIMSYRYFYNQLPGSVGIRKGGDQGEILQLAVNGYRSYVNNIHILVTQSPPAYEVEVENSDQSAKATAVIGREAVEHYFDRDRIDTKQTKGVQNAVLFGEDFIETPWNDYIGEDLGVEGFGGEGATIKKKGDVCAKSHGAMNVARDINLKSSEDVPWHILRYWDDRWKLAAQHREFADHIMQCSADDGQKQWYDLIYQGNTAGQGSQIRNDQITCYKVWHEDNDACPEGREILVIGGKTIYTKEMKPRYDKAPLSRMTAGDVEGTFLPYSSAWDLLSLFQGRNALATARLSNAINGAMSLLWSQDPNTDLKQLRQSFGLVSSAAEPKAINLSTSAPAVADAMNWLEQEAQGLSGLNPVARGSADAISGDKSGAAYALILSTAIQFQTDLQSRYKRFGGDTATNLIYTIQNNMAPDQLIKLAGKSKTSMVREFKKERLSTIRRVKCKLSSPLLQTTAGKVTVADAIQTRYPTKVSLGAYCELLETGNLDVVTGPNADKNMSIEAENEAFYSGKQVAVLLFEHHLDHINGHLNVISTPSQKEDPNTIVLTNDHIKEHLRQWGILTATNPQMLQILGLPPLFAPPPMQGQLPGAGAGGQPPAGGPGGPSPVPPPPGTPGGVAGDMPNMPSLPQGAPGSAAENYAQFKVGGIQ